MKKRPLCVLCIALLMIKGVLLLITSGESPVKIPASSIFYEMEEEKQDEEILIQGQVYKKADTSNYQILYLKNSSEPNIIVYDDSFANIPIGKTIVVKGKAQRFSGARNPGNFDAKIYYAKQKIYGMVWSTEIVLVTGKEAALLEALYRLRRAWKGMIAEYMSEENEAVLCAMLLGETEGMEEEMKELYQKSGISHILAISGLHISFIGLGIYRLLRKAGLPYGASGILALAVLGGYVLMIGISVSVFRAFVMLLFRIGADMSGRVYDMLTALMVSAAFLILYQPLFFLDAAFYMSYGAVLGILFLLPKFKKTAIPKGVLASVAINGILFPILLWFYFEFPVYSILLNLVVIPLVPAVLAFGMFGSLGCLFWEPLGSGMLFLCDKILQLFARLGEIAAELPLARIVFGKPEWWKGMLYYGALVIALALFCRCKRVRERKEGAPGEKIHFRRRCMRFLPCIVCIAFPLLVICLFTKFPNGKLQVTMLDVGQGDCIFMKGPTGITYLIDGGSSDVEQVGKYRMEPFLKSQGVANLDYVFVSHGDFDHYSGIAEMLERQRFGVKIRMLVLPSNYKGDEKLVALAKLAWEQSVEVAVMDSGMVITEKELAIGCIWPDTSGLSGNAGSMVLSVTFGQFDMLLTGDVEGEGEEALVQKLKGKSYEVLKVAHHGSKNSTGEAFLKIVQPDISLISAGRDNFYGHPHTETLERLKETGSKIYKTMDAGAIQLEITKTTIDIF